MGRRMLAVAAAVVMAAGLAVGGCIRKPQPLPSPTPQPSPEAFAPGADGVGDTYFPLAGNGGYDVTNYDLELRYEPAKDTLTGKATIAAVATANLSRFNLDFHGLTIESATVDGKPATVQRTNDELTLTPAAGISRDAVFTVVVSYGGVPQGFSGFIDGGFLHTDDGAIVLGEPEVATAWFPVNDHPRDKATYTVKITVPDGLAALSNGVLKSSTSAGGWTTWTWAGSKPMASYLATLIIGKYRVVSRTHDGLPVVLAVDSDLPASADTELAKTPAIVDFLEASFGPYPFDAMGGVVIDDNRIRYALENQTRPVYPARWFDPGEDASWVLVHELAHQWFGDSVAISEWKDIWLNEGFASYAEWLWEEHNGGRSAQARFDDNYAPTDARSWLVPPGDPGKLALDEHRPVSGNDIFVGAVYHRGAMTLHALRVTVGDSAFFAILKAWAAEKAHSNATTPEFIALAERISTKELDGLFNAWLYGQVRPPRP